MLFLYNFKNNSIMRCNNVQNDGACLHNLAFIYTRDIVQTLPYYLYIYWYNFPRPITVSFSVKLIFLSEGAWHLNYLTEYIWRTIQTMEFGFRPHHTWSFVFFFISLLNPFLIYEYLILVCRLDHKHTKTKVGIGIFNLNWSVAILKTSHQPSPTDR